MNNIQQRFPQSEVMCQAPAMDGELSALGRASVHFNDYVGTAAADDADAFLNSRSLYQLAGLDRERWLIVSVEMSHSRHAERVTVFAVDRERNPVDGIAGGPLAEEVPVVAFDLPASIGFQDFIQQAFQRVTVQLVSRTLDQRPLTVLRRERVQELA